MAKSRSVAEVLGIPHSALVSIVFGMMLVSFPLGAYVVFHTDIGGQITHQIPLGGLSAFGVVQHPLLPQSIELGDVFVAAWAAYAALFAVAIMGPGRDMAASLKNSISLGGRDTSNYMIQAVSWFSVLVLASTIIDAIQGQAGLSISPPDAPNDLVQFYLITLAPLVEEPIFRVALVGLPVFAMYTHRASAAFLLKSLWHPTRHLHIHDSRRMIAVVLAAGVVFGVAHALSGESWGVDKVAQASVAGIILGYVYCRYGLVCGIILHWASNYFLYAYGHFVAYVGDWGVLEAFEQPFFGTIQAVLIAAGAITLAASLAGLLAARPPSGPATPSSAA